MRIFRESYTENGKRKKAKNWYCDFTDCFQRRHKLSLFAEKRASEGFAAKLEELISERSAGQQPSPELSRWLERIPNRIAKKFVAWGLLDSQ